MLQYFEENGFEFRDLDEHMQSPLHCACSFGHLEAFKYLMRKGVCCYYICSVFVAAIGRLNHPDIYLSYFVFPMDLKFKCRSSLVEECLLLFMINHN